MKVLCLAYGVPHNSKGMTVAEEAKQCSKNIEDKGGAFCSAYLRQR